MLVIIVGALYLIVLSLFAFNFVFIGTQFAVTHCSSSLHNDTTSLADTDPV